MASAGLKAISASSARRSLSANVPGKGKALVRRVRAVTEGGRETQRARPTWSIADSAVARAVVYLAVRIEIIRGSAWNMRRER